MAAEVCELLADGPPYSFGGTGHQHTFVLHSVVSWNLGKSEPFSLAWMIRRGTRGASAHSNSYPTVPADSATASTEGPPSPQSTTRAPTPASGMSVRSTASMSMDTRPSRRVGRPATTTGVPVPAWRGYPSA